MAFRDDWRRIRAIVRNTSNREINVDRAAVTLTWSKY